MNSQHIQWIQLLFKEELSIMEDIEHFRMNKHMNQKEFINTECYF